MESIRSSRVREPGAEEIRTLEACMQAEREAARTYLRLSRQVSGRESLMLRRMFEQAQAHGSCLWGLYTVSTGRKPDLIPAEACRESLGQILRECYGKNIRLLSTYEARSSGGEYAPVFARLRDGKQIECTRILELMGSLSRKEKEEILQF